MARTVRVLVFAMPLRIDTPRLPRCSRGVTGRRINPCPRPIATAPRARGPAQGVTNLTLMAAGAECRAPRRNGRASPRWAIRSAAVTAA